MSACYVCGTLDPDGEELDVKEICGWYKNILLYKTFFDFRNSCMEHTIHLMACHFVGALGIPLL